MEYQQKRGIPASRNVEYQQKRGIPASRNVEYQQKRGIPVSSNVEYQQKRGIPAWSMEYNKNVEYQSLEIWNTNKNMQIKRFRSLLRYL